ncbi:UDP-glucose 4-epimerase [bioreactor metagenome]|uniref:UDP-glucose 4-epimerase n=1 Tax=bioreactor metagenome TaxID=1076179 RepID=A0A644XYG2_9ZZZZ
MKKILVTGGLGYIGSHTVVELINAGFDVVIADDLSNSEESVLERIFITTGTGPAFFRMDVCDRAALNKLPDDVDGVIHFAAYKSVGESVQKPLEYYRNNIGSLVSILDFCRERKIESFVFSSSCTVYGQSEELPVTESAPFLPAWSPYGHTKQVGEDILKNFIRTRTGMKVVSLRYFNPAGAHELAFIGELPRGVPNNLMPYITQTAIGLREKLQVFGGDYNTKDGTAVRDYIHVSDLAQAHVKALEYCNKMKPDSIDVFNLGSGSGYTVLEVIRSFEKMAGVSLPYEIVDRRPGDVEKVWADTTKAKTVLGFVPVRTLDEITLSAWKWEQNYRTKIEKKS